MKSKLLFLTLALQAFAAGSLDFSKQVGILDNLSQALIPLIAAIVSLVIIIAGYLYITGKGNVGKETLINVVIGSIVIGVASTLAALFIGN
ncbi:MAG: TrbC/VirB2 family protein [Helicobacteraceae bacterium]